MLDYYLELISKQYSVPKTALPSIKQMGTIKSYSAKEHMINQGDHSNTLFIVISGLIRSYTINADKEWTITFFKEGDFAGDYQALILQKPVERSMLALEDTLCFCISFDQLKKEFQRSRWFEQSILEYIKTRYSTIAQLKMDIMGLKPENRYDFLKKNFSWAFTRIPDRYLACYMGVTPVSFSRIKNKSDKLFV